MSRLAERPIKTSLVLNVMPIWLLWCLLGTATAPPRPGCTRSAPLLLAQKGSLQLPHSLLTAPGLWRSGPATSWNEVTSGWAVAASRLPNCDRCRRCRGSGSLSVTAAEVAEAHFLYLSQSVKSQRIRPQNCDSSWSCKLDGEETAQPQVVG